jgi:hypothetical protein
MSMTDIISLSKRVGEEQWEREWKSYKPYRFYNQHFNFSSNGFNQVIKPRSKETLVARLRLGTAALNSHLHKIGISSTHLCAVCLVPETVDHVILNCSGHGLLNTAVHDILKKKKLQISLASVLADVDIQTVIFDYCKTNQLRW